MKTILTLILFLIIGIVGSKGWVSRTRIGSPLANLFITGVEFFFVGVLLGPSFLNIITPHALDDLKPFVYLALGWAGLLFGIQLSWLQVKRVSKSVFKMMALDSLLITIIVAGAFYVFLTILIPDAAPINFVCASFVFAITASISSPTIIAVLARRIRARGEFTSTVRLISSLNALIPLLIFGVFFIFTHPDFLGELDFVHGLVWWVFANVVGVILGSVMVLLSLQRCTEDERLLLVVGIAMLVGGVCFYLRLSTLYTAMVMGIVVGNFSPRKDQIFKQLLQLEKSVFIAFLILVGAMVSLADPRLVGIVVFYVLLRFLLKTFLTKRVLLAYFPSLRSAGKFCGMALIGQGGIALAMVLDFRMTSRGALADTVASAIILAVVINEILGFYLTRVALQASGDTDAAGGRIFDGGEA